MTRHAKRRSAATVELYAGEPGRAETILRSALQTLDTLGETVNSAALAARLAEALCRQDRHDEAEPLTETSERTAWPDDMFAQVGWRATRAQVLAQRGDPEAGERLAREAVALLEGADSLDLRGDALLGLAATLSAQGRDAEADAAVREAAELYDAKGNLPSADRARLLLAGVS